MTAPREMESDKRLGQLLVERGVVSGPELLRGIVSQRAHGGRLGTCLLEMSLLGEKSLIETLARQSGVPAVEPRVIRSIPEDVIHLLSSGVAARCRAVPFAASDTRVDVAMADVRDLKSLDDLSFCLAPRRPKPYVASEIRIYQALQRYYQVECSPRFARLIDRLERSHPKEPEPRFLAGGFSSEIIPSDVIFQDLEDVFGPLPVSKPRDPAEPAQAHSTQPHGKHQRT